MKKSIQYISFALIISLIFFILWFSTEGKSYLMYTYLFLICFIFIFLLRFEKKQLKPEEIIIVGIIAGIAAIARIPFASIPGVQPTTFIIIMVALGFGGEIGFIVGCIAALVSNIFLGQGPWTPWQMFSWGIIGFTAGITRDTFIMKNLIGRCIFGFIWGFLFGWIMNIWFVVGFNYYDITWKIFLASCVSSFKFDLAHAISNVLMLYFFSNRWERIFHRIKKKYNLMGS